MNENMHDNENFAERVKELEKQARWMKAIAIAAVLMIAVSALIYHHQRYRIVTAQEFVLEDSVGRQRARLALFPEGAGLEIYAASGEPRVQLVGGGEAATLNLLIPVTAVSTDASVNFLEEDTVVATFRANASHALLDMRPTDDRGAATLALRRGGASLVLAGGGDGAPKVSLQTDPTRACAALGASPPAARSALCLHSPGLPALELVDLAGKSLHITPR